MRHRRPQIKPCPFVERPLLFTFVFRLFIYLSLINSLRLVYFIMGSTSGFPTIKEVRTFLIDGVGSGGDYHNVSPEAVEFSVVY